VFAAALVGVGFVLVIAVIWLRVLLTGALVRKAVLFLLAALEITYAVAAVLSVLGLTLLGLVWLRGRRRGKRQPSVARGLLLCGSVVIGVVLSEVAIAAWQNHMLTRTPMPVGGLGADDVPEPTWRLPARYQFPDLPTQFPDPPGDQTVDIAVLGESSAAGVPFEEWLSLGKIVAWQLEKAIPARPIRLTVLAESGDTLERQHNALAKLVHRPDLFIVYCGHNEFSSRLYWMRIRRHYLDVGLSGRLNSQILRVEKLSSVCRLIREESDKCLISIPPAHRDHRDLVDVPVYTETEYKVLLADFRERLEAIVTYAQKLGSLVVVIVPPGNDADYDPNRSWLPAATLRAERAAFSLAVLDARRLEALNPAAALAQYRALVAAQPGFAEVRYRLAKLLEQSGATDEAYRYYIAARDLDGYPQRMLTAFQTSCRDVATLHDCILIDGQAYFHKLGKHGLLDDDLFQDAMHPSLRGQVAIAQAVLQALQAQGAFGWPSGHPAPMIDPGGCAAHFGMAPRDWAAVCHWCAGFYETLGLFRYENGERATKSERYRQAQTRIEQGDPPESLGIRNIGIPRPVPLVSAPGVQSFGDPAARRPSG
jgi:lysophospholipase L1-like esterase